MPPGPTPQPDMSVKLPLENSSKPKSPSILSLKALPPGVVIKKLVPKGIRITKELLDSKSTIVKPAIGFPPKVLEGPLIRSVENLEKTEPTNVALPVVSKAVEKSLEKSAILQRLTVKVPLAGVETLPPPSNVANSMQKQIAPQTILPNLKAVEVVPKAPSDPLVTEGQAPKFPQLGQFINLPKQSVNLQKTSEACSYPTSNLAVLERGMKYDVIAEISKEVADESRLRLTTTPEAIVRGVVESIEVVQGIANDLSMSQQIAMRSNLMASEPPMYAFSSPDDSQRYIMYDGTSGQPVGMVGAPPAPLNEFDKGPSPKLSTKSAARDTNSGGNVQRDSQYYRHSSATMNPLKVSPFPLTKPSDFQMPPFPYPSQYLYPHQRPSYGSHCPTCGINPHASMQTPYSRYRLPSPRKVKDMARSLKESSERSKTFATRPREITPQRRRPLTFDPPFREPSDSKADMHIGQTKWRDIEKQLNYERAPPKPAAFSRSDSAISSGPPTPRRYEFGPQYRRGSKWHEEYKSDHHKQKILRGIEREVKSARLPNGIRAGRGAAALRTRDRTAYEGGLTTYRRSPYRSLNDLATYYTHLDVEDQSDVISLLLSCRKLEKQIEEQHVVIDMLDHDLQQAQQTLRFPPEWQKFTDIDLAGTSPGHTLELPDGNLPLYLKGRVLLQQKEPPPGFSPLIEPDMARAIALNKESAPAVPEGPTSSNVSLSKQSASVTASPSKLPSPSTSKPASKATSRPASTSPSKSASPSASKTAPPSKPPTATKPSFGSTAKRVGLPVLAMTSNKSDADTKIATGNGEKNAIPKVTITKPTTTPIHK